MNDFFSWELLATFAGASIGTLIITQALKGVNILNKIPSQGLSYIVALCLLALGTAAAGSAGDWHDWAIIPFNAVLVSLASNGEFDGVKRIFGGG